MPSQRAAVENTRDEQPGCVGVVYLGLPECRFQAVVIIKLQVCLLGAINAGSARSCHDSYTIGAVLFDEITN